MSTIHRPSTIVYNIEYSQLLQVPANNLSFLRTYIYIGKSGKVFQGLSPGEHHMRVIPVLCEERKSAGVHFTL